MKSKILYWLPIVPIIGMVYVFCYILNYLIFPSKEYVKTIIEDYYYLSMLFQMITGSLILFFLIH